MASQHQHPKFHIRDLCRMSNDDLQAIPEGLVTVAYDDGEVVSTKPRARTTAVVLRHFFNKWPKLPVVKRYDIGRRGAGKMLHAQLMRPVMRDTFEYYQSIGEPFDIEKLWYAAYDGFNDLYNTIVRYMPAHVKSLNILDFVDVVSHPEVKSAMAEVSDSDFSIERAYRRITAVLEDANALPGNRLSEAVRNGLVDKNQVLQCVGPRGKSTDLDSHIFPIPLKVGFTHGFSLLYDSLVDSRLAAKAQSFTGPPLQATEYFNRQLQLIAHSFARVHDMDCGATRHIAWRVRAKDLGRLDGKYYKTPDGYRIISENDRHLVDQLLEIRTVLYCQHPDSQGCCRYCYGEIARSIPKWTNVGHVASTNLGEKISQNVLAIKHVESSSTVGDAELSSFERKYLQISSINPNQIQLADRLRGRPMKLEINSKEAPHISDVTIVQDVSSLQLGFVSELSEIRFHIPVNAKETDRPMLTVYSDNRPASLSRPMLQWIREKGWEVTDAGTYLIDLEGWDVTEPLFELPMRHASMLDYAESIKSFMCAAKRKGAGQTLREYSDAERALKDFYALVSSRLDVNIVHLEVLIKVLQVRSRAHRDYRLPLAGNKTEFGEFNASMYLRSMSAAMAYQGQKQVLEHPMIYLVKNRPPHILDAMLVPTIQ